MKEINEIVTFISENKYLRFLAIVFISLIIAYIAKFILKRILKPLSKKTKTKIDDIIIKSLTAMIFYIIFLIGFKVGLQSFELKTTVWENVINTILVIIICLLVLRIIEDFASQWMNEWKFKTKTSADERLIPFLKKIFKVIIIILTVFFVFDAWKVDISPLLATAGIAGLAIGLAVKDSLNNILGGLQLVLDRTFKVGDKVQLESGELGVILDIGLRSTKLRTYDHEVIYIPNGYLANAKIKNYTQPDFSMRVNVNFGVEYGSDPEKVQQVVLEAIKKIDNINDEPAPVVQFIKMSDFSLDFIARAWVKTYAEAYTTQLEMTDKIYNALNKANIGIPFPTQTTYSKKAD